MTWIDQFAKKKWTEWFTHIVFLHKIRIANFFYRGEITIVRSFQSVRWFRQKETKSDWDYKKGDVISKSNPSEKGSLTSYGSRYSSVREKIASDLAFVLNLPVPSILLGKNIPHARFGYVSLTKYSDSESHCNCRHLHKIDNSAITKKTEDFFDANISFFAKMWVFETWINNNNNRKDKNGIMVGYTDDVLQNVYFQEFYRSMPWIRRKCNREKWENVIPCDNFPLLEHIQLKDCLFLIREIELLTEFDIKSILSRLPSDFITKEEKDCCRDILFARGKNLRASFEKYFSNTTY